VDRILQWEAALCESSAIVDGVDSGPITACSGDTVPAPRILRTSERCTDIEYSIGNVRE
jgi:hypothetical protein